MRNEKETRQQIDDRLKMAGWDVDNKSQVIQEYFVANTSFDKAAEPEVYYQQRYFLCDYVLLGSNGKPLAVVEAKKASIDARAGEEQAKQYCKKIEQTTGFLPFCFYTNGYDIWFWDLGNYPPRKVYGFPERNDMERWAMLQQRKKTLSVSYINTQIAGRGYQIQAIRSILDGITEKRRKFLLVMATGTGKTRTVIALMDALMRAGWAERVLFLVDRIALCEQAMEAFKEFLPEEPRWVSSVNKEIAYDKRVYIATLQTMQSVVNPAIATVEDKKDILLSPHFFDLIVVDESHRSIYNTYKNIIEYFDAVTVGLTATPTDAIDRNTFKIFDCDNGMPSFAFLYDEAIQHVPPYLCDFEAYEMRTKFQEDGINKRNIKYEDQLKLLQEGTDVEEIEYEGSDLERAISNDGTNVLLVREFMETGIKDANGVIGKSIFFCVNQGHARRIAAIFNRLYPSYNGELARVLTSSEPRVYGKGGLLDQFANNDMPRVAISVDMLDTGIDVREIVNLVFAKRVMSYTKFWQMIGRGTRLLDNNNKKTWCLDKNLFLIFDAWDNFEFFKIQPKGKELPQQTHLAVRLFTVRLLKLEVALNAGEMRIIERECRYLYRMIEWLSLQGSVLVKENQRYIDTAADGLFWKDFDIEKVDFLRQHIQPIMRALSGIKANEMRFERDVVEYGLALLMQQTELMASLSLIIATQISELPLTVNTVAVHQQLITHAQTQPFWLSANDDDMERLIQELAPLMHLRETNKNTQHFVHIDIEDQLVKRGKILFNPNMAAMAIDEYREKMELEILRLSETHPLLQKIKQGETPQESDLQVLAAELEATELGISEKRLQWVYRHKKAKLLRFLRHIFKLEILPTFAQEIGLAFEQFIAQNTQLNSQQIEFLHILRDFLIEKGDLERQDLLNAPFSGLHRNGVRGLFSMPQINLIIDFAQRLVA